MSDFIEENNRPLWCKLSPLKLPIAGLGSVFHCMSGALLFPGLYWLLGGLDSSHASAKRN